MVVFAALVLSSAAQVCTVPTTVLEPTQAPPPNAPTTSPALRDIPEGTYIVLEVQVSPSGTPLAVSTVCASAQGPWVALATNAVRRWRFSSAASGYVGKVVVRYQKSAANDA